MANLNDTCKYIILMFLTLEHNKNTIDSMVNIILNNFALLNMYEKN